MRRGLIRLGARAATSLRLDEVRFRRAGARGQAVLLNLHSVAPTAPPGASVMSPETFRSLLGWLTRHCELRALEDLSRPSERRGRPRVVLSFDDGYRDFLDYAMPILDEHRIRVNQNVVPSCVDSGRPPWNVQVSGVLATLPPSRLGAIELDGLQLNRIARRGRDMLALAVSRHLKLRSRESREEALASLAEQVPELSAAPVIPMMTSEEVQAIAAIHEVGVHSFGHDSMGFETDDFLLEDVGRCRRWFAALLNRDPDIYAFPNGSCRPPQPERVREAGISRVLLVGERPTAPEGGTYHRITTFGARSSEARARVARCL